jgi:hypothetical protein
METGFYWVVLRASASMNNDTLQTLGLRQLASCYRSEQMPVPAASVIDTTVRKQP